MVFITREPHSRAARGHLIKAFQPKREICSPPVDYINPQLSLRLEEGDIFSEVIVFKAITPEPFGTERNRLDMHPGGDVRALELYYLAE